MPIRFKCPHCKKPLAVKEHLAGKRGACPACKKPIVIPAPIAPPADLEDFAAAALTDEPPPKEEKPAEFIELDCPMCGDPIKMPADLAGKQGQCPACRNIIKVPMPKSDKPKDWRDIGKKGPAAALINLPEQLDDAWGTELKGRVSRESLEDAGAIEIEVEPVGIGGWIKRGLIAAALVGIVSLIVIGARNRREQKTASDAIADARDLVKNLEAEKDPKKRLDPVLIAMIDLAEGIRLLQQDKGDKAREKFVIARSRVGGEVPGDSIVDVDLFLIELARAQIELGGNEDQVRSKARIDWDAKKGATKNAQNEIRQTLDHIKSPEARVIAVREIASELIVRKKKEMAIGTASSQSNPGPKDSASPVLPLFTSLVFAHGDMNRFNNLIKPPDPKLKSQPLDTRLAYAQGHALKGEYPEAKMLIDPGPMPHKREACVNVVCVLLTDRTNKEAVMQAAQFVDNAVEWHKGEGLKLNPWHTLQLCRAAYRYPKHAEAAKELASKLPKEFKRRAQLEWLLAQLEKGDARAEDLIKELPEAGGAARGLAWVALGRHFGSALPMPENPDDAQYRVFARIGQMLGKESAK